MLNIKVMLVPNVIAELGRIPKMKSPKNPCREWGKMKIRERNETVGM